MSKDKALFKGRVINDITGAVTHMKHMYVNPVIFLETIGVKPTDIVVNESRTVIVGKINAKTWQFTVLAWSLEGNFNKNGEIETQEMEGISSDDTHDS